MWITWKTSGLCGVKTNKKHTCSIKFFTFRPLYFDNSKNIVDNSLSNPYTWGMKNETAAKKLAELGHITRLSIFRYLVKVGDEGAPVGQIQEKLNIPGSTLSHHISRLVSVGLIRQVRESRTLHCIPQFEVLNELVEFLKSECCTERTCRH